MNSFITWNRTNTTGIFLKGNWGFFKCKFITSQQSFNILIVWLV